ncbi:MAG: polynucleotide kinase-phosphatase [Pyrinomonadaceae bacterium MAG19_C2-C3]|nr:polynucleotide kinase-phosphatase [Pyrinomonadaceae bacterium MAG19_C2-C3]
MKITIPELSLVVLIGASGSGKSTFAREHFRGTEVLSSDYCRGLVSDDENNQSATKDAFEVLHFIAAKRLQAGNLTVVDATNVQPEARKPLVALAREYHVLPIAIVLNVPERVCRERNATRADRDFGSHVVRQQNQQLRRSLGALRREGFRHVFVLKEDEIESVEVERQPLWNNLKHERGAFDIIGDVHGCFDELCELLKKLGYVVERDNNGGFNVATPDGRRAIFLGDLVDRGNNSPDVLRLVMSMRASGAAFCVPGNHDMKLMKKLSGKNVQLTHGLAETLAQLEKESPEFTESVRVFLDSLVSHYVMDDGKLVVAHAGLKEKLQGRGSGKVRDFCLYGETTGETDEYGLPVRYNWAAEYRGKATVIYGHTPVPEAEWLNNTINIDTGCVFGGRLSALRYPECELVSVDARAIYYAPAKPFLPVADKALNAQQQLDDVLDLEDVTGKRIIETTLARTVTIREQNATAALEVMSRFAANPKWLTYLPPTMSPSETTKETGLLEHPREAFSSFLREGIGQVVCEEKHMGSRAVVVVCREREVARKRFGITEDESGVVYTRTGRRFFDDAKLEAALLERINKAFAKSGLWDELETDWAILDCELMPWSAKAQELLRAQYAAVGCASRVAFDEALRSLQLAQTRTPEAGELLERFTRRAENARLYTDAYRRYCWTVSSLDDLRLAPFHLLATEGAAHFDKNHLWHIEHIKRLCDATDADDALLIPTNFITVDVTDAESQAHGIAWWESLTDKGGEGMVVKPLEFIARGGRGLVQPAIKCRGREYLRIIYGVEYTAPENLERLRARGLSTKRSLALREFALGVEGLERFVRREPLRRVHECVFGVLALESEPVDPRL